jgi:hypothetical protein
MEVERVELIDGEKKPALVFHPGDEITVRLHYRAHADSRDPVFGVGVYRSDGTYLNGSNHYWREHPIHLRDVKAGEHGTVDMRVGRLPLLEGQYYLTTFLDDHSKPAPTAIDHREHALVFQVVDARRHQHGILRLPSTWTVHRHLPGRDQPEVEESPS